MTRLESETTLCGLSLPLSVGVPLGRHLRIDVGEVKGFFAVACALQDGQLVERCLALTPP